MKPTRAARVTLGIALGSAIALTALTLLVSHLDSAERWWDGLADGVDDRLCTYQNEISYDRTRALFRAPKSGLLVRTKARHFDGGQFLELHADGRLEMFNCPSNARCRPPPFAYQCAPAAVRELAELLEAFRFRVGHWTPCGPAQGRPGTFQLGEGAERTSFLPCGAGTRGCMDHLVDAARAEYYVDTTVARWLDEGHTCR